MYSHYTHKSHITIRSLIEAITLIRVFGPKHKYFLDFDKTGHSQPLNKIYNRIFTVDNLGGRLDEAVTTAILKEPPK